jgi:hypothetical protein
MRSTSVFKDFGGNCSRLERPGYGQKQVADDLIFAWAVAANWHPGWLKNRGGFAFSPHFRHVHDTTPFVRIWTAGKAAESVLISIQIVSRRDDFLM